ncbi:MAG TPA: glycogen synthase GlgA [bacterium]|nr:glycogen synthase GlgA [bacterium]
MSDRLRVCVCTSEAVPFAKTGGLADVAGALPRALADAGCDVRVALPAYQSINRDRFAFRPIGEAAVPLGTARVPVQFFESRLPGSAVPVHLVASNRYFDRPGLYGEGGHDYPDNLERFTAFCRGTLALLRHIGWSPQVLHCQDWQTALLPVWLRVEPRDAVTANTGTLFTVHNLAYQGLFPPEQLPVTGLTADMFTPAGIEFYGKINLLKGGLVFADLLSTVSAQYAREIQTEEFGCGLEGVLRNRAGSLVGILNGVDYAAWDPATDRLIPATYTPEDLTGKAACKEQLQRALGLAPEPRAPLIGMITRLADQKGLDLVSAIIETLMDMGAQFALLGTGDPAYHTRFQEIGERYRGRAAVTLGFDETLAHRIEAGADIFLMPSRYEPSGLNQLYSLRYGTVPVVRKTGGLADTIVDATPDARARGIANGFVFEGYSSDALLGAVTRALVTFRKPEVWRRLQAVGMRQDFSWGRSADRYVAAYRRVVAARAGAGVPSRV